MTGNHRSGFTLIELLLVTAVFSVAVLMSTTVYSQRQNDQRRILVRQQEVADGRYLLETMARSVRVGTINYLYYDNAVTNPTDILTTTDQDGITYCYKIQGSSILTTTLSTGTNCGAGTWTPISVTDMIVDEFKVFITPRSDPFRGLPASNADCFPTPAHPAVSGYAGNACKCGDYTDCYSDQQCVPAGAVNICEPALAQPMVTLVLRTHVVGAGVGSVFINMQTTVTSHVYQK